MKHLKTSYEHIKHRDKGITVSKIKHEITHYLLTHHNQLSVKKLTKSNPVIKYL